MEDFKINLIVIPHLVSTKKQKKTCNDILWGVFPKQSNQHCPGFPNNLKIKRYRPVKCHQWHTSRTGPNASKAPIAKKTKNINDKCSTDSECKTQNCHNGICSKGNFPNGNKCSYNKQCDSNYCKSNTCQTRKEQSTCWYNDNCFINGTLDEHKCSTTKTYCDTCPTSQRGDSNNNFPDFTTNTPIDKVIDWGETNYNDWKDTGGNKTVYCKF